MPVRLKCRLCGTEIVGDGKGHMIYCECGKLAIDETPYYYRVSGNPGDFIALGEDVKDTPNLGEVIPDPIVEQTPSEEKSSEDGSDENE